jgi:hypothetical protein
MHQLQPVEDFFSAIADDPRINTTHISLYMALLKIWGERRFQNPIRVFSHEVMPVCKISGIATYHKSIRELHQYGYIRYVPSYYRYLGSLVYMSKIEMIKD